MSARLYKFHNFAPILTIFRKAVVSAFGKFNEFPKSVGRGPEVFARISERHDYIASAVQKKYRDFKLRDFRRIVEHFPRNYIDR